MTCWHFHNLALGNPDHAYFAMAPFLLAASLLVPIVTKAGDASAVESASAEDAVELGLLKFKSWELLDPSSTRALERAHKQPFRNYLNEYVDFHQSGRAKELMPDPFFTRLERLESPPNALGNTERSSIPSPPPPVPPGLFAQHSLGACRFEENHDFSGVDIMTIPGSSREQCCRICQRFNQRSPGTCAVAVLSSANDDPPYSCWVKSQLQASVPKEGVVACIPE
eukprot:symbB.v1.2.018844.t1/scaffold1518.1/size114122/9